MAPQYKHIWARIELLDPQKGGSQTGHLWPKRGSIQPSFMFHDGITTLSNLIFDEVEDVILPGKTYDVELDVYLGADAETVNRRFALLVPDYEFSLMGGGKPMAKGQILRRPVS